tara:strand:+ start:787 stop:1359 length:573 start_codon:yes stop_codon:yes gene_type:complete
MNNLFYVYILLTALMLSTWWLWFFKYKSFYIDDTRQKLFKIRDQLFLAALDGKIGYDETLYKMTRTTLNGAIQYSHNLSAVRFAGALVVAKIIGETFQLQQYRASWDNAFEEAKTEESKELIKRVHAQMHLTLFHHVVRGSLILKFIVLPILILLLMLKKKTVDAFVTSKRTEDEWITIDVEANMMGRQC